MKLLIYIALCFLSSSCGSKDSSFIREKDRLKENQNYAALLFKEQAPEKLPIPIDLDNNILSSLSVLDSLLVQQAKEPGENTLLSNHKDSIYITTIPCTSPLAGQGCLQAFVSKRLELLKLSHLVFPFFVGIEIEKQPSPTLFLIEEQRKGTPYTLLLSNEEAIRSLGKALGEFHKVSFHETKILPPEWEVSIGRLSKKIAQRYQTAEKPLQEAALLTTHYLTNLLNQFKKKNHGFSLSYTLGNCDLKSFFLTQEKQVAFSDISHIAASMEINSEYTPCGLSSYDYSLFLHRITQLAAQSLSPDKTKKIRQAFETGYKEETGFLPPKEELRFFLLIDLFNRIETETNFTHSLLEQELLSWAKTLKKCDL